MRTSRALLRAVQALRLVAAQGHAAPACGLASMLAATPVMHTSWHSPSHHRPTPASSVCTRGLASLSAEQASKLTKALTRTDYKSLYHHRPDPLPDEFKNSVLGRLASTVLLYHTNKNQLIIGGQLLYDAIKEQVDDGTLHKAFGLDPKIFYSTFTLLAIHVWLVVHRLGTLTDKDTRYFTQRFYNHFQADVEHRIYAAGVQVGVTKWLKKLETVFYSSGLAFDRVLRREGDDTLEGVVLREFFGGDSSKRLQASLIAKYLLHELSCMELTEHEHILKGQVQFSQDPFLEIRLAQPSLDEAARQEPPAAVLEQQQGPP